MSRRWIHRVTAKEIFDIEREKNGAPNDMVYEYIGAWRYFEAIELWLRGEVNKAQEVAAKVRTDKFIIEPQRLMRARARIAETARQEDPFTETRIAAHQQRMDWDKLVKGDVPDEVLTRIKARHEAYRQCQPELNPEISAA